MKYCKSLYINKQLPLRTLFYLLPDVREKEFPGLKFKKKAKNIILFTIHALILGVKVLNVSEMENLIWILCKYIINACKGALTKIYEWSHYSDCYKFIEILTSFIFMKTDVFHFINNHNFLFGTVKTQAGQSWLQKNGENGVDKFYVIRTKPSELEHWNPKLVFIQKCVRI